MDSIVSDIDHGDSSHKKRKKVKRKSTDAVPHCGPSRNNLSADNELRSEAGERGMNKKLKMKARHEKVDVVVSSDDLQPEKRKRKLSRDAEEIHTNELPTSREGHTDHDHSTPRKKKKLKKSFHETGKEVMADDCIDKTNNKGKHFDNNLIIVNDSICEGVGAKITKGVKTEFKVREGSIETSLENNCCNPGVQESSKAAKKWKKKKNKLEKLNSQEEMNSRENCNQGILPEVSTTLGKQDNSKSVTDPSVEHDFCNSMKVKTELDDGSSSKKKKKKKARNDLSCADTDCSSSRKKEESVIDPSLSRKKKRKHRSSFCVQEETDNRQDIKKEISLQSSLSLETSKKIHLEGKITSAEGSCTDEIILDDCFKKQKKEKKCRKKVSNQEICKVTRSDDNNSLYQEDIVDKLWMEIKSKIESKLQPKIKNIKNTTASEQKEEFQGESKSAEGEGDWHSMIFKFDNNPFVRHYVPRKLMALNGLSLQLKEMKELNLKIPKTLFKGSSLDSVTGYGYNT